MKLLTHGATRWVLLTKSLALKFPRPTGWKSFLNGLLCNLQERDFAKTGLPELCPVYWSDPIGLLVVMPRAQELSRQEFLELDYGQFTNHESYTVPVEYKQDSFGIMDGKIVAIDYGS